MRQRLAVPTPPERRPAQASGGRWSADCAASPRQLRQSQALQRLRDPGGEKPPFSKLLGKEALMPEQYQANLQRGMTELDKFLQADLGQPVADPSGKFDPALWDIQRASLSQGARIQYEMTLKDEKIMADASHRVHYKNTLVPAANGEASITALSNYGPTREQRTAKLPGCNTFLTDAWAYMLHEHRRLTGSAQALRRLVRSNIENPATLATIFLSSDFRNQEFTVASSAMDRIALLGSDNGIGYLQMMNTQFPLMNMRGLIESGRFPIDIKVYGSPHARSADMVIG